MKYLTITLLLISFIAKSYSQQTELKQSTLDSLKTQLETIFIKDQTFRKLYSHAEEKFGKESPEMDYFWEVVESEDKELEKEVFTIIDNYGWLGISEVGRLANTTLWGVLQHGSIVSKKKYSPLLKASVMKNESQPSHYARMIDRMLINDDKSQVFGTQLQYNSAGKPSFFPIEKPEYVNKRRKEIGLNSIQEFAKTKKIAWTIAQKI